ncbi:MULTISPECIES: sensor histidine kinase [Pseudomonas]|nr:MULTISPECIES: sensor histidine kinase [Pseudomonas]KRC96402.1 histidine kinase [Pseudomonas sp. Root9]
MLSYKFKPRARLIRTIGDKLVSGPVAAIVELVKNAHDADSENSVIQLKSSGRLPLEVIEISDRGEGMIFETVINSWMEPATESKVNRTFSNNGRRLLGSKGIGRFAASRLGELMTLSTSAISIDKKHVEITTLRIDWKKFDGERYLDQVPIQIKRSIRDLDYPTGTCIRIRELRDKWVSNEILELYRELRRLISPIQKNTTNPANENANNLLSFDIFLDLCSLDKKLLPTSIFNESENGPLKILPAPILDSADYEVTGRFDKFGKFTGEMKFNALGEPFSEPIEDFFSLEDEEGLAACGELEIRLLIFDREAASIDALISRAGLEGYGKRAARQILDDMAGVGIYRDNFRIRPYGDKDQDWLGLSRRRVDNPSIRLSPNQIAGFISIAEEEDSGLIERSSREGLEANGSYKRLQQLITSLLGSSVEPMRRKVREGTGKGKRKPRHDSFIEAAEFTWKEKILSEIPASKRDDARVIIESAQEELKRRIIEQIEHERFLEARATLGKIIAEVLHELRSPLKSISGLLRHLSFDWKKIATPTTEEPELKAKYSTRIIENTKQAKRMEKLLLQLDPLATKRSGPMTVHDAYDAIISSIEVLKFKATESGINLIFEAEKGYNYIGHGDELQTSIINLIDNSLFWLTKSKSISPIVKISLYRNGQNIIIRAEDNGPGIKDSYKQSIFEAGFTTKVSEGQGLGLAISKESLARIGGTIELKNTESGCTFEITIKEVKNV